MKDSQHVTVTFSDNEMIRGILIGKTKDALFLFSENSVKVIPSAALVKMVEYK